MMFMKNPFFLPSFMKACHPAFTGIEGGDIFRKNAHA